MKAGLLCESKEDGVMQPDTFIPSTIVIGNLPHHIATDNPKSEMYHYSTLLTSATSP
jgi:hypothetical protein